MRPSVFALTLLMLASSLHAQQPQPSAGNQQAAMQLFASAADINGLIAKARTQRKPDQPNFVQPVVKHASYSVNLEYRVAGLKAPASVHEREAELFFVVEGSGTAVTGGKLRDEKRTNAENLSGSDIDGGSSRPIAKGDVIMVPENVPHWFNPTGGALVMLSLHLPKPPAP